MPCGTVFYLHADCICSPFFRILMPAFVSRLWTAWQIGHSQIRMRRFFTSGFRQPQKLQVWLLGYMVGTLRSSLPYQTALYSSISKNFAHETLAMDFASLWFRIIPFTCRSSMQMVWFSRTSIVDCFCRKSFLWFVTFSCTRATRIRCLLRLWEPFCFRESLRCSLTSFCIARSRYFGFDTVFPLLSE